MRDEAARRLAVPRLLGHDEATALFAAGLAEV